MRWPILYLKGSQLEASKLYFFLSLLVVLILANIEDQDEMQQYAAFYLGLHCLPKYTFRGSSLQRVKAT